MGAELPSGWRMGVIRDVVDPLRPVTYGVVQPGPRQEKGVPIIRGMNYSSGLIDTTDLYLIAPSIADAYRRSTVREGDLLFSIVGYLGLSAQVPEQLTGANITQTTARIAVRNGHVARFFLHLFRSPGFAPEVRRWQKGSAQPGLNLADVERLRTPIPPEREQRRIAEILDAVDGAIKGTEAVIAKLRALRQGLHAARLSSGDVRMAPMRALSDVADCITKGTTPTTYGHEYTDKGVSFLRVENISSDGRIVGGDRLFITYKTHAFLRRSQLAAGDVLITIAGTIGRTAVVEAQDVPANVNQAVALVRPKSDAVDPWYLRNYLASRLGQRALLGEVVQLAQANLSLTHIGRAKIPCPPLPVQSAIAGLLTTADKRTATEEACLAKLKLQKQGLMQDLLTGRVRVKA